MIPQVKKKAGMESPYQLIETPGPLEAIVKRAESDRVVAVDLEADSMYHYHEKICLLQLATTAQVFVVDCLAICDLSPLAPLFKDARVQKVFHGADYDIRSLYRDYRIEVDNLFDTQLASQYLGLAGTGLEAVARQQFGVTLNKKYQRIDWSKRPLADDMLRYAAEDVRYLIPLAKRLTEALQQKGRLTWVREECARLSGVRPHQGQVRPLFLTFKGAGTLPPRNLAVLEALLEYRDGVARRKDKPLFKVFSNRLLLQLADNPPADRQGLERSRHLSAKQMAMYGDAIIDVIQKALALSHKQLPRYPRRKAPEMDPAVPARIKALKSWRTKTAARLDLPAGILANKALLTAIAAAHPQSIASLKNIDDIRDWQIETFGEEIVSIMRKSK